MTQRGTRRSGRRRDLTWSFVQNGGGIFLRALTFVLLSRELGPSTYGAFVGLYAILGAIGGLTYGGLRPSLLQRFLVNGEPLHRVVGTTFTLAWVQGLVGVLVATAIGGALIRDLPLLLVLGYAVVELLLLATIDAATGAVHAARSFGVGAQVRFWTEVARTCAIGALSLVQALSLTTVLVSLLIINTLIASALLRYVLPKLGVTPQYARPTRDDVSVASHLSVTWFASGIQQGADKALLNAFGMNYAAGVYGAAHRVVSVAMAPATAIQAAYFDRFLATGKTELQAHMSWAWRFSAIIMTLMGVGSLCLATLAPFLPLILGSEYADSSRALLWLSPMPVIIGFGLAPANTLAGLNQLPLRSGLICASALLSVGLLLALIPTHGWKGAAVAAMAGQACYAVCLWAALLIVIRKLAAAESEAVDSEAVGLDRGSSNDAG